jgi:uncharacterized protein YbjT (DUF2867 family)
MTILVTGATGAIGGAVVRSLATNGFGVAAAIRDERARSAFDCGSVTARRLDYDDPASYANALRGVDSVFLVAPPADPHSPARMTPFIKAIAASDVKHVVVNSAVHARYSETFTLRRIERAVEESGVDWTHVRLQWHMSSLTSGFFAPMAASGEFALPTGPSQIAFVHVRDVADSVATILRDPATHAGTAHALTGPEALNWYTIADMHSRHGNRPVRYRPVTDDEYLAACTRAGIPRDTVALLLELFIAARHGQAALVTSTVRRLTGREPRALEAFLSKEIRRSNQKQRT